MIYIIVFIFIVFLKRLLHQERMFDQYLMQKTLDGALLVNFAFYYSQKTQRTGLNRVKTKSIYILNLSFYYI